MASSKIMSLVRAGERLLLTLWVGGLWTIGYLATPTLFHQLEDRQLAGELAGSLFKSIHSIGLLCGVLLLAGAVYAAGQRWTRVWQVWALIGMLTMIAVSLLGLQPMMQELKQQRLMAGSAQALQFGRLHGISSVMYLVTSLLGLALVLAGIHKTQSSTDC